MEGIAIRDSFCLHARECFVKVGNQRPVRTRTLISVVRSALRDRQRAFRVPPGLVADGRDMGTVIFPDASHKVFLTASAAERAERRYKQLKEKGVSVTLDGLLREILARDARDANRAVAPLRPAEDAVRIDTTGLGIEAVVERVLALLPGRSV